MMSLLRRTRRYGLHLAGLLVLAALAGLWSYQARMEGGLHDLRALGRHRLDLAASSLEREIDKYAYFPATLGLETNVLHLLHRQSEGVALEVNGYLEQLNRRAGTLAVYILDAGGHVVATSNWNTPESFMGEDLSYRPYFYEAVVHGSGRFFGIGTTLGIPGYYLSSAIVDGEHVVGVAVVKVSLEQLERSWISLEVPVLVTDENGVAILSSVHDWKFATLQPLDAKTREDFDRSQHYNRRHLEPLPIGEITVLDASASLMTLPRPSAPGLREQFLAQSAPMPGTPWTLTVMSQLGQLRLRATTEAALAAIGAAFLCILGLLVQQRIAQSRERLRAREALQRAHDELELKVEERTADLSAANLRLRSAQDELVQAGKLAVIGQLSTGIAHELNQPLAALRTLSANAAKFMERGDLDTASGNLQRIGALVDSMGKITSQLKNFARKSSGPVAAMPVRPSIDNALFLLEAHLRKAGLEVRQDWPDAEVMALCEPNRLEQVLVNLIGNAADAMAGRPESLLEIAVRQADGQVRICIRDHGPGISDEAARHLFEPFFTTKDPGAGLGLGLPISAGIIRDFGGTLEGANHPEGGAIFTIVLPTAESESAP
jgi:two-component system C4-dicarboxylate transport sensor histidine kinase DctB